MKLQNAENYSGKFVVRVPKLVHKQLVEAASRHGVSLNAYINAALSKTLGEESPAAGAAPLADLASLRVHEGSAAYRTAARQGLIDSLADLSLQDLIEVRQFIEFLYFKQLPGGVENAGEQVGWSADFFTSIIGGWQGEPVVRERPWDYEIRQELE